MTKRILTKRERDIILASLVFAHEEDAQYQSDFQMIANDEGQKEVTSAEIDELGDLISDVDEIEVGVLP